MKNTLNDKLFEENDDLFHGGFRHQLIINHTARLKGKRREVKITSLHVQGQSPG
jgi:hypothetical protein